MRRRLDERRADSPAPKFRLDEQPIEFGFAFSARNDRKTGDAPAIFGDQDLPALYLLGGKGNGVGIGLELLAILFEGQRSPPLQLLELQSLFRQG